MLAGIFSLTPFQNKPPADGTHGLVTYGRNADDVDAPRLLILAFKYLEMEFVENLSGLFNMFDIYAAEPAVN